VAFTFFKWLFKNISSEGSSAYKRRGEVLKGGESTLEGMKK